MKKIEFRYLTPEDVECRPTDTKKVGEATLLLYIDSRSVVELMDEAVGPYNWTMEFEQVGDQVVGKMGVWDEDKQMFIYRSDTGSESNVEASKGLFSDCYKRCIARWGLTDLYNTPRIKLKDLPDRYYYNGKLTMTFSVQEIEWDENRKCKHLVITDRFGNEVYRFDADQKEEKSNQEYHQQEEKKSAEDTLVEFCKAKKLDPDTDITQLSRYYQFYKSKTADWKGAFQADTLWTRWMATAR